MNHLFHSPTELLVPLKCRFTYHIHYFHILLSTVVVFISAWHSVSSSSFPLRLTRLTCSAHFDSEGLMMLTNIIFIFSAVTDVQQLSEKRRNKHMNTTRLRWPILWLYLTQSLTQSRTNTRVAATAKHPAASHFQMSSCSLEQWSLASQPSRPPSSTLTSNMNVSSSTGGVNMKGRVLARRQNVLCDTQKRKHYNPTTEKRNFMKLSQNKQQDSFWLLSV